MISCVINVIKEKEIDTLVMPWVYAQVIHLMSVQRAAVMVEDDQTAWNSHLGRYNIIVHQEYQDHQCLLIPCDNCESRYSSYQWKNQCDDPGSMHQGWFPTVGPHSTKCLYQVEKGEQECHHGSEKLHGLSPDPKEEDSSSEGSHSYLGIKDPVQTSLTGAMGEDHSNQMPKLTVKQRQEKLLEELGLSGLESWPPELVASAQSLLA